MKDTLSAGKFIHVQTQGSRMIRFRTGPLDAIVLKTVGFEAVDRLHYPLTFVVSAERHENGLRLGVRVEYNRALFSAAELDVLVERFSRAAMALVAVGELR